MCWCFFEIVALCIDPYIIRCITFDKLLRVNLFLTDKNQ
ncbi:hypothetical protein AB67_0118 [Escherichia coli 5-366-08_S1_C3]|nr:hypothetical protein AB67_0118 [Escherichia coli 5-366-08_S1_C3]